MRDSTLRSSDNFSLAARVGKRKGNVRLTFENFAMHKPSDKNGDFWQELFCTRNDGFNRVVVVVGPSNNIFIETMIDRRRLDFCLIFAPKEMQNNKKCVGNREKID